MTFGAVFPRVFRPAFGPGLAGAAAAATWWTAGGATGAVAVYQPKGAASLAASYTNLANPGTNNAAPGTAPTFNAATGWTFDGATQHLSSGVTGNTDAWSYLFRYSGATGAGFAFGSLEANRLWGPRVTFGRIYFGNIFVDRGTLPAAGIYGQAGVNRYLDGASDGAFSSYSFTGTTALEIGRATGIETIYFNGSIQAVAIYNTTLTAPMVAAISTAMAAL